jgi:hypothetical protein
MNAKGKLIIAGLIAGGALVIACGNGATQPSGTKDKPMIVASAVASIPVAPKAAAPVAPDVDPDTIVGDGTFAVGGQVKPGTYRTVVPADSFGCYYERLRGASGEFSDIISNGNGNAGAQLVVTVKSSDKYFHAERCGTWKLVK